MKKIIATSTLLFVFIVFLSINSYSQEKVQEPVKTEQVKTTHCNGHANDATKASEVKSGETPKHCTPSAASKCPSTCPHAKAAMDKKAEPANTTEKRTPIPQK